MAAAALAFGLASSGWAAPTQTVELTLDEARLAAAHAVRSGDHGRAIQLARGLLKADARDPVAYFVLASAHGARGESYLSRRAAGYAFRYADAPDDKYLASQLAARAALYEGRPGLAQLWLRRSDTHAQTDGQRQQIAEDYARLRRINPWSFRLNVSLRPSSNVNNGSEDTRYIIDGVPTPFVFDGAALALEGLIGTLDLHLGYRLRVDGDSATFLGARIYTRHVALSSDAQAQAPGLSNSALSSQYLETSLSHRMRADRGAAGLSFAIGQAWSGNNRSYALARLGADRSWRLSDEAHLSVSGAVEERFSTTGTRFDATALSLTVGLAQALDSGDKLTLTLGLRDTDAASSNDTSQAVSLRAGYTIGEPIGPVSLDLGLTLGYADYDTALLAPGGRQDVSAYADLNLTFQDWSYAGFSPALRIRAGRTRSNVSRFTTREFSVGLGVSSNF